MVDTLKMSSTWSNIPVYIPAFYNNTKDLMNDVMDKEGYERIVFNFNEKDNIIHLKCKRTLYSEFFTLQLIPFNLNMKIDIDITDTKDESFKNTQKLIKNKILNEAQIEVLKKEIPERFYKKYIC